METLQMPINIKMDKLCSVTKWNMTEGNEIKKKNLQLYTQIQILHKIILKQINHIQKNIYFMIPFFFESSKTVKASMMKTESSYLQVVVLAK